jgi:hypothetical protein
MQHLGFILNAFFISFLLVEASSASCNVTFSNLTTCAVLNGMSSTMSRDTAALMMSQVEGTLSNSYNRDTTGFFKKSDLCKDLMYNTSCIMNGQSVGLSTSNCKPVKICFNSCVQFARTCLVGFSEDMIAYTCLADPSLVSNEAGCYNSNGQVAIFSPPPPPPPPPPPTSGAIRRGHSWVACFLVAGVLALRVHT